MARKRRTTHLDPFATDDFNEQLYEALRRSPWWLTSLMLHGLILGALLLLGTSEAADEPEPVLRVSPGEQFIEEVDPNEKLIDPTPVPLPAALDPRRVEDPTLEPPQVETDSRFEEEFGEPSDSLTSGFVEGPSKASPIGIGPGGSGPFGGRGGKKNAGGGGGGPTDRRNDALDDALEWLALHQSPDGSWGAYSFADWCDGRPVGRGEKPGGRGKALYDVGVTGLAVCAFLGAGYSNRGRHKYNRVVGMGLRFLKNVQDPEGCFGTRSTQQYIYNHAIAALAMVEAYGMTGSPLFRGPAQRALDFISLSRNPYGAWRYGIKPGDNDTSVTGWMMMALKSASLVNASARRKGKSPPLSLDTAAFDGIRSWLSKVTDPDTGRVGYLSRGGGSARPQELIDRFPSGKTEAMTAVGVLARTFAGEDPRKSDLIRKGADRCIERLPTWNRDDGSIDMYYWYYGTLGMFQVGGKRWDLWNAQIDKAMVKSQRQDGRHCLYKGSWDPVGPWGLDGGRVYSTAMMAMCLEVHFRYDRVFTGNR